MISILLPTRNGGKYLKECVKTILSQSDKDFELVISDNFSSDGTNDYLKTIIDKRVRVVKPPSPLMMNEHFEFILKKAKGEWITVIGDDDGLMPYFFDLAHRLVAKWGKTYEIIFSPRAYFFWPGVENIYGKSGVDYKCTTNMSIESSRLSLQALMFGGESYFNFPQFYSGTLFSKKKLEEIWSSHKDGNLFHSIIVDANSVALILLNNKRYLKIGTPLVWVGASPKSLGAQAAASLSGNYNIEEKDFEDFKTLNKSSKVQFAPCFKSIYRHLSNKACFLEALYQTSYANNYRTKKNFSRTWTRHRMFLSVFKEYLEKKRNGPDIRAYEELFHDNNLSLKLFSLLMLLDPFLFLPVWIQIKIRKRVGQVLRGRKKEVAYTCFEPGNHEDITSANLKLQSKIYRHQIDTIINQLVPHAYPK
jgi:glycosyltransferase involved in cell wall biosynthesis